MFSNYLEHVHVQAPTIPNNYNYIIPFHYYYVSVAEFCSQNFYLHIIGAKLGLMLLSFRTSIVGRYFFAAYNFRNSSIFAIFIFTMHVAGI